jgi:serine/threonine protein kinase/class 3 adenylate cyclase
MKLGPFQLAAQLDASNHGVTYRGVDVRDSRPVEVHMLAGARGDPEGWDQRTRRLRLAALVTHPAARRVLDFGLDVQPFYVGLEWLDGSTLARELGGSLPLPVMQAVAWGRGLATALAAGHRIGIAHGHIAPGILRCTKSRVPKIDFSGLPTGPDEYKELDALFRAPERSESSLPDFPGDVFGLGCLLCWFVTGRPSPSAGIPQGPDFRAALPTCDPTLAERLEWLLRSMLAVEPSERPAAHEVEECLAAMMPAGKPAPALQLLKTNIVDVGAPVDEPAAPVRDASALAGASGAEAKLRDQLGRYRLREKLGEGGMGEVWRADDPVDGTCVAIKILRPDWARKPASLRRFHKEARLLSEVRHPNVAGMLEVNHDAGLHYLVLEFIAGQSLDKVLADRGKLDERTSVAITAEVARALEDAHRRSIVHRDIKPGNIVLLEGGAGELEMPRVKLLDFGLARHIVESESLNITEAGTMLGTPLYMAPEQGMGRGTDARADIYALGATLFHLLSGRPPFEAESAFGLLAAHATDAPPPLRQLNAAISEATCQVVEKCLAKTPEARYADASALLSDLERLLRGEPTHINIHPKLPIGDPRRLFQFDWVWDLEASPAQLWPYVSNTERLNRAAGLPPVKYTTEPNATGGSRRYGEFRKAGVINTWREHPFEWVEGRRMGVLREYSRGVLRWLASIVELEPRTNGGTRLTHRIRVEPRNLLGRLVAALEVGVRGRKSLGKVYQHIDAYLTNRLGDPALADAFEDAAQLPGSARRRLDRLLDQLVQDRVDPLVVERLGDYLASAAPQEVARIRPLALARRLGLDPDQVVAACLRGARAGLLVLLWDVLCPVCRIPSDVKDTLRALKEHSRCEACNLDYELDFANSVELIFRAHPEIRTTELAMYCIGGPSHSPHVAAQVRLMSNERIELELALPEGAYRLRGPQLPWTLDFQVEPQGPTARWDMKLSRGLDTDYPRRLRSERQVLALANDCDQELIVRVERLAPRSDALTAARASALALFRELFPAEVLAPGQLVSVTTVTLLVTHLEEGRRLYADLGDAKAFTRIHDHFQRLRECISREGGAVVKTVGEGLLATFPQAVHAVRAGLAFQEALAKGETTRELRLRVAIHSGPAMAVTLNEHLDYFGTTVSTASQLLEEIEGGDVILTPSVAGDPQVTALLVSRGVGGELREVELPGLGAETPPCLLIAQGS